jgi:aminoglycoside 3-N-acetyltransferase
LRALGLAAGDIVLVHSSMKALGRVEGGPDAVIDAFLDVLGRSGTLVFPSFQAGGEHELLRNNCVFDVRSTPTGTGLLPETFRRRPGVTRSLSPTHCMAVYGKNAVELMAGHELCDVSAGRNSPFEKMISIHAKIVLLGVTHAADTTLHFIENTSGAPTLCRELFQPSVIDTEGRTIVVPTHPHMPGLRRRYERVEDVLILAGIQKNGMVGQALTRVVDAAGMAQVIGEKIRRDPLYLIEVFTPSKRNKIGEKK